MIADTVLNDNFISFGCDNPIMPILLAAPHAGRDYPPSLMHDIRIAPDQLVRLEDRYVDLLVKESAGHNISTVIARAPRTIIDLNRSEDEIDADMVAGMDWSDVAHPSAKTRGGLGLIPRRLSGAGEIWNGPLSRADLEQRITNIHRPYHAYIESILKRIVQKFGIAVLIDVHSMPPLASTDGIKPAQWVIGDRYGASSDNIFTDIISNYVSGQGYRIALNSPYSGGYILRRHGKPQRGQHALQIEIDRSLYLDDSHREPIENIAIISNQIKELVDNVLQYLDQIPHVEAAE